MSNRAWMPLHIDDYLADTGHLTGAEHGAYMLMIMHYWQNGSLPENERLIARIARMDASQWEESRDVLAMLFGPNWKHKRIDAELAKADDIIEKRRNAGRARQEKRNPETPKEQVDSTCSAHAPTRAGTPGTYNLDNYAASAAANDISARMPELYSALGVTDETKTPGLLSISEPINWTVAGCDIDADILPTLRSMAARGKVPRSWSYCTNAVFEARDRRLAPAPAVQPQHRQAAPPPKPRTVAELAIHRLRTGDFRNDDSSNSDRFLGAGDGPGQDQSARILELAAIAAHGRR